MEQLKNREWWNASLTRGIRTVAQTAIASIGSAMVLETVDWRMVLSASVLSGAVSLLMSLSGLPEVGNE